MSKVDGMPSYKNCQEKLSTFKILFVQIYVKSRSWRGWLEIFNSGVEKPGESGIPAALQVIAFIYSCDAAAKKTAVPFSTVTKRKAKKLLNISLSPTKR